MKIVTIVGARPQFIKAAPVSRVLRQVAGEVLVHTGQHYDHQMSRIFFTELHIPEPDYNLGVGSGSHGWQTGQMLLKIEEVLLAERPDGVLVYGDTNSTLAGALAAVKLHIPVAHVEAGLRSFNRRMPEEHNRVLTDHAADLLFCPTQNAVDFLVREGLVEGVYLVGDVMYDAFLYNSALAGDHVSILGALALEPGGYVLATVHRPSNTDDPVRLRGILRALEAPGEPVVLPLHPRTAKALATMAYRPGANLHLIEPVGYLNMLALERQARCICTDSGGVQKEAYMAGVPCVTLREETEWVETVAAGWNVLVGADPDRIVAAVRAAAPLETQPALYGDGRAAEKIVDVLMARGQR
ncbi:MAG: UDP-N-acetylglucosamine 2-epimerase (non-hydrolyzing) [Anaerolineae bacterium]|nr:UDP-N-acetylglucosamine 2-epimerase (non-hydrolyzing) [Anaerolineae bacterium]